jgi:hypothetical protein
VGHGHLTAGRGISASGGRLGWRSCLRKGCGQRFQARQYNQRYCREPECLREVRRWQAAKRQQKCRSRPEARQRHAEAERQRRKQRASEVQKPSEGEPAAVDAAVNSGAWSRSRRHPEIFCDRPGCYEPPRDSFRVPASYCGDDCRAAMRQARDRERKWLRRRTEAGRFKRRLEYQAVRAKRRRDRVACGGMTAGQTSARSGTKLGHPLGSVLFYRRDGEEALDSRAPPEVIAHDPQRTLGSRPRPPPAS